MPQGNTRIGHWTAGLALAALICTAALPAFAQSARDLAPRIDKIEQSLAQMQAQAPNEGSLQVRVLKLEALIEQLTGQVEEANFRAGQLQKQLKTMEDDLQLRVARLEAGGAAPSASSGSALRPTRRVTTLPGSTKAT